VGLSARHQPCLVGKEPLKPQFGSFEKRVRLKSDLGEIISHSQHAADDGNRVISGQVCRVKATRRLNQRLSHVLEE
jgi:hypothetical protein